jgi:hypothetical protein
MKSRLFARVVPCSLLAGSLLTFGVTTQAADVVGYGVLKGQQKFVVAVMPPLGEIAITNYFGRAFVTLAAPNALANEPTLDEPGGNSDTLSAVGDAATARVYQLENPYSSPAQLDAGFRDGAYTLTMMGVNDGQKAATLTLGGAPTINIPAVDNSSALSAVNPKADFAVSWGAFTGGGANDFIQVRVELLSGDLVSTTPSFGAAGALDGTATSIKIPANTLPPSTSCYLVVMFAKLGTRDATSYSGAVGVTGYFQETKLMLTTTAGSTPTDTTPPTLVFSSPTNNATGVPINAKVRFTFDEAMMAAQSIAWSANVTPVNFAYSWSTDAKTLTCTYATNLPANAPITWKLNPSGSPTLFQDAAGNALPSDVFAGTFTTGTTTTNDLCNPEIDESRGSALLAKSVQYVQNGADAPVEEASEPAMFALTLLSPTNNPVTSANLQLPNGTSLALSNFFGRYWNVAENYTNAALLDESRPNGNYILKITRQNTGQQALTLSVPAAWPPVPQILNPAALQAIDPGTDFAVQWDAFTAATDHDGIFFGITKGNLVFYAPDPCVPRRLPTTATSITVPSGTLAAGETYNGDLQFTRITTIDTNSIADITGMVMLTKEVHFTLKTTGGVTPPKFTSSQVLPSGHLELQLNGEPGRSYTIETCTDLPHWSPFQTVTNNAASGIVVFDAGVIDTANRGFFRAKVN